MSKGSYKINKSIRFQPQSSLPSDAENGEVMNYDSKLRVYQDDEWKIVDFLGSSDHEQGELTYIDNPSAASAITGWTSSNETNLTVARSTTASDLPRENLTATGIKILGTSYDETNVYIYSSSFTLDDVDIGRILKIQWDQKLIGAYAAGNFVVDITDTSNNVVATPVVTNIPAQDGTFATTFYTSNTGALRLRIKATTNIVEGVGICISNVIVGPGQLVQGAPLSDWVAFTPTGSWITNTTYSGYWRRVGDSIEMIVRVSLTGAPTGAFYLNPPSSLTFDTTKFSISPIVGEAFLLDNTVANRKSGSPYLDTPTGKIYITATGASDVDATTPFTWGSSDSIRMHVIVPITGWSSGVYLGSGSDNAVGSLDWTPVTMTTGLTGGSGITVTAYEKRIGDTAFYRGKISWTTVPTGGTWGIYLPSGRVLDTTKDSFVSSFTPLGVCTLLDVGGAGHSGVIVYAGSTSYVLLRRQSISSSVIYYDPVTTTSPFTWADADSIEFNFSVPIVGWTTQEYLGKILTGFAEVTSTQPGLIHPYKVPTSYNLTVTDTNWTTDQAIGLVWQDMAGNWYISIFINGNYSVAVTAANLTVSGISVPFQQAINVACFSSNTDFAAWISTGEVIAARLIAGTAKTNLAFNGTIRLDAKPTFVS